MKENLSEIISEFIKDKKDNVASPEAKDAEEVKADIVEKLVQKKFGKKK